MEMDCRELSQFSFLLSISSIFAKAPAVHLGNPPALSRSRSCSHMATGDNCFEGDLASIWLDPTIFFTDEKLV